MGVTRQGIHPHLHILSLHSQHSTHLLAACRKKAPGSTQKAAPGSCTEGTPWQCREGIPW